MKNPSFEIGGQRYHFRELTLKDYYVLQTLLANPVKGTEYEIVQQITGCPVDVLKKIKYKDWILVWEETQLVINSLVGNADNVLPIVEFKGVEYGLVPVEDMTLGEFVDLDLIINSKSDQNLQSIAAILYRPLRARYANRIEVEPYDPKTFEERKLLFEDFPLKAIKSANSFFLQYANSSLKNTLKSLEDLELMNQLPESDREILQNFLHQDLGGLSSIPWLEETLFDLQRLQSYRRDPHLTGLRGKKNKLPKLISKIKNKLLGPANDYPSLP